MATSVLHLTRNWVHLTERVSAVSADEEVQARYAIAQAYICIAFAVLYQRLRGGGGGVF